ncbi:unnamed protein product [Polarella glacialis]|uniref:C3H1-type domain-containing protein n=1 Tax=Polarella glacialis TaxID=89957 RepID=A0A813DM98_POLGL|nr:unnamed protein product [Polarella glacialis]
MLALLLLANLQATASLDNAICQALASKSRQVGRPDLPAGKRPVPHLTRDANFRHWADFLCEHDSKGSCANGRCSFGQHELAFLDATHQECQGRCAETIRRLHRITDGRGSSPNGSSAVSFETGPGFGLEEVDALLVAEPEPELCENELCLLGPPYDGGYHMCIDRHHLHREACTVYSFGIGDQPGFEVAASALGCEVHMFDHSVTMDVSRVLSHLHHRVHFHPFGLSDRTDLAKNMMSLPDIMGCLGHDFIDVLKIDCEGCEWNLVDSWAKNSSDFLSSVGQITLEAHLNWEPNFFHYQLLRRFVSHVMRDHQFSVARRSLNPWSLLTPNRFLGRSGSSHYNKPFANNKDGTSSCCLM